VQGRILDVPDVMVVVEREVHHTDAGPKRVDHADAPPPGLLCGARVEVQKSEQYCYTLSEGSLD